MLHILYYTILHILIHYPILCTSPLQVYPQEIQTKRNFQSQKSTGFDSQQNTVSVGDVVNVISGGYIEYVYVYVFSSEMHVCMLVYIYVL